MEFINYILFEVTKVKYFSEVRDFDFQIAYFLLSFMCKGF